MDFKELFNVIKSWIPPIHKEGHIFVFIFAVVTIFLCIIWLPLGFLGLVATIWCALFFRDPERVVPVGDNFIVSPADGVITKIEKAAPPAELGLGDEEVTRITIFLNIFNVHINRFPVTGEVVALNYHPGKFLSANLDKASVENERQSVVIKTNSNTKNALERSLQLAQVMRKARQMAREKNAKTSTNPSKGKYVALSAANAKEALKKQQALQGKFMNNLSLKIQRKFSKQLEEESQTNTELEKSRAKEFKSAPSSNA
jgi:phosphatidylserine decarboxylase precursor-related protein